MPHPRKILPFLLLPIVLCLLLAASGCGSDIDRQLDEAEAVVLCAPDSAESILNRPNFNDIHCQVTMQTCLKIKSY